MKKIIIVGMLMIALGFCYIYREELVKIYVDTFVKGQEASVLETDSPYYKDIDYAFVQITNDFEPKNTQHLLNIYYTVINSGASEFTFYCTDEYTTCINDVELLASNQSLLSHVNNFVHSYNGFKYVSTEYDTLGKVTININHTYSESDISVIEEETNRIFNEVISPGTTVEDKIQLAHDYIINNTKYDSDRSDHQIIRYRSDTAYGPLFEGYGICSGYTDLMAIYLDKMEIPNYKVASENHIWNAVYINGEWLNLDLTWDDPITQDGSDVLGNDFFLKTTEEIRLLEDDQHNFPVDIYIEMK